MSSVSEYCRLVGRVRFGGGRVVAARRAVALSRRGDRGLLDICLAGRLGVDVPCGSVNIPGIL